MSERELLFSVTAANCRFDYYKGTGAGGQKKNKTSSACRVTHLASGAVGNAEDDRSQHVNKRLAFGRMARTKTFQTWARLEGLRRIGVLDEIERKVDMEMRLNTQVYFQVDGRWVPEKDLAEQNHSPVV